ncbi:MAG: CocE/NonD family hydrolase [Rhodospirillaceae bacterium]|nr:CocE/NonD family hydrolase [Rhodospirillaceae bacterium]
MIGISTLMRGVVSVLLILSTNCLGLSIADATSILGEIQRSAQYPGVTCQVVESPMRDGTILRGFLYLPDRGSRASGADLERYPAIIERSPYGHISKHACFQASLAAMADFAGQYAQAGYAYLMQATRGTYISDGRFSPFAQERADGYDTISWVTSQPWCNGEVGARGPSYHGVTAVQTAVSMHPSLRAASFTITAEDYHREWAFHHGVPMLGFNLGWAASSFAPDAIQRKMAAKGADTSAIERAVSDFQAEFARSLNSHWLWHLPLDELPHLQGRVPAYYEWLAHPEYDEFWQAADAGPLVAELDYPVLVHASWYDIFANGAFEMFRKLTTNPDSPRAGSKLVVSQYGHGNDNGAPTFGRELFNTKGVGYDEEGRPFDMAYFDRYLKQLDNGFEATPPVRMAVMVPPDEGSEGYSFALEANGYPPAGTQYKELFLDSDGRANTRAGDGRLLDAPKSGGADSFTYDPQHPVPSVGGNLCCGIESVADHYLTGAAEQAGVESREDVLVYTSEPLENSMVVIGRVSVTLFAQSSALDTDFTAKLVDVHPDGATHNVVDGVVRARFRSGSKVPTSLIVPGQTYEYQIDLGHTATVFPAGHRVRLQISSSNFPRFARNLNTGKSNESTSEMAKARQVVLHDERHPSRVTLPVAPNVSVPRAASNLIPRTGS